MTFSMRRESKNYVCDETESLLEKLLGKKKDGSIVLLGEKERERDRVRVSGSDNTWSQRAVQVVETHTSCY